MSRFRHFRVLGGWMVMWNSCSFFGRSLAEATWKASRGRYDALTLRAAFPPPLYERF